MTVNIKDIVRYFSSIICSCLYHILLMGYGLSMMLGVEHEDTVPQVYSNIELHFEDTVGNVASIIDDTKSPEELGSDVEISNNMSFESLIDGNGDVAKQLDGSACDVIKVPSEPLIPHMPVAKLSNKHKGIMVVENDDQSPTPTYKDTMLFDFNQAKGKDTADFGSDSNDIDVYTRQISSWFAANLPLTPNMIIDGNEYVLLFITVERSGNVLDADILWTSGSAVLDDLMLKTIYNYSPVPAVPDYYRPDMHEFSFVLPVYFNDKA